jgi:hypothetical protein
LFSAAIEGCRTITIQVAGMPGLSADSAAGGGWSSDL